MKNVNQDAPFGSFTFKDDASLNNNNIETFNLNTNNNEDAPFGSFTFKDDTSSEIPEWVTTSDKLGYGYEAEPHIFSSLASTAGSYYESYKTGEDVKSIAQRKEEKRMQEIYEENPEYAIFKDREEDATVLLGRVGAGFTDPVTLFMPWTRVAKGGIGATALFSGTVAAGETALRDMTLYGETNATNTALAFGVGSIAGAGSDAISRKFLSKKTPDPVKPDAKTAKTLEEISEEVELENPDMINSATSNLKRLGVLYREEEELNILLKQTTTRIDKARKARAEKKAATAKKTKTKTKVKEKPLGKSSAVKKVEEQIKEKRKEILELEKIKLSEDRGIIGFASWKKALNKGLFSDEEWTSKNGSKGKNLYRAFVQELVRPVAYGTAGGITGIYLEEDSPRNVERENNILEYATAGFVAGFFHKRIKNFNSDKLSRNVLKDMTSILKEEEVNAYTRTLRERVGKLIATSNTGYFEAANPVMQKFGLDMLRSFGSKLKVGTVRQESVEELTDANTALFTNKLSDILDLLSPEDLAATGRLIQNKGMKKKSEYTFLKEGDLTNTKALEASNKYFLLQEEFKQYIKNAGILLKEEEVYGLTQLYRNVSAKGYNVPSNKKILTQAFIKQWENNRLKPKVRGEFMWKGKKITKKTVDSWAKTKASAYLKGADEIKRAEIVDSKMLQDGVQNPFSKSVEKNPPLIKSSRFLDTQRKLYDPEARAIAKDLFVQDPIETTLKLYNDVIPYAEFSRVFGSRGQGLIAVRKQLRDYYSKYLPKGAKTLSENKSLDDLYKADLKDIARTINSHFKVLDYNPNTGVGARSLALSLQTLLATTKLTKVVVPSIGDLIQVIQNSGVRAAASSALRQIKATSAGGAVLGKNQIKPSSSLAQQAFKNQKDFEAIGFIKQRKYKGDLEKELYNTNMTTLPESAYQEKLMNYQQKFFTAIGLSRVTRFAREFAFDAGVYKVFSLSKKLGKRGSFKNLSSSDVSAITNAGGMSEKGALFLSRFKTIDEAYGNATAKRLLDRAGLRAADRDALIPQIGNRRLFAQSANPLLKFAGTFLSWAQAKGTQTSALLSRIENSDGKLLAAMIASMPLYAAVRQLHVALNPSEKYREATQIDVDLNVDNQLLKFNKVNDVISALKEGSDSAIFSGQVLPWHVEKAVRIYEQTTKGYNVAPLENIYPALAFINDSFEVITKSEGPRSAAVGAAELTIPFAKDVTRRDIPIGKEFLDRDRLGLTIQEAARTQDRIKRPMRGRRGRQELKLGGPPVSNVKDNPEDRSSKYLGESFFETTRPSLISILEKRNEVINEQRETNRRA
tara:strand:+ start:4566 stop:8504 length:3939 start_codon:yes stop_codon:yes gene_type:complete